MPIGISLAVMPSATIRSQALPLVLLLVPRPGIVTPMMRFRSQPSLSNASTATINANVLSSPPDIPITAERQLICESLVARPRVWMAIISSHLASLSLSASRFSNVSPEETL